MDRLTRKSQSSEMVWFIDHDNNCLNLEPCEMSYSNNGKAIRKLAEYENTGLTPKDIEQMKARMPLHQWAGESPDKMSIFGVPVSRIMELTEAEKQGRLVVLSVENCNKYEFYTRLSGAVMDHLDAILAEMHESYD